MGTVVLSEVSELTTIKISEMTEAVSAGNSDIIPMVKGSMTQKIQKSNYLKNSLFGDEDNCSFFESDGRLHFKGTARPVKFYPIHSTICEPTHHNPLEITSLSESNCITVDGMDTSPGSQRRIEVIGIDGGVHVKGRIKATCTREDTTHKSSIVRIKLNTANATWEQTGEWRLILDILSGNVVGRFTCFMPAFSMMEYSNLYAYVTQEGSIYFTRTKTGFDNSLAGPSEVSANFLNNESAAPNVVIEVANTAGFYEGNQVFVSDSLNSEWTRIKTIVTNVSITVDVLLNSYATANGAKLEMFNYTRTAKISPIQRGLLKTYIFEANINSGITFQLAIPQEIDPESDIAIVFQYLPTENNPSSLVTKWRSQYIVKTLGDTIPDSIQYGALVDTNIIPPATIGNSLSNLCTIPAATHAGKHISAVKINRLGSDDEDTYLGNIKLVAFVIGITTRQLGYET